MPEVPEIIVEGQELQPLPQNAPRERSPPLPTPSPINYPTELSWQTPSIRIRRASSSTNTRNRQSRSDSVRSNDGRPRSAQYDEGDVASGAAADITPSRARPPMARHSSYVRNQRTRPRATTGSSGAGAGVDTEFIGRRRSHSDPTRAGLASIIRDTSQRRPTDLPDVEEVPTQTGSPPPQIPGGLTVPGQNDGGQPKRRSSVMSLANSIWRFPQFSNTEADVAAAEDLDEQYNSEMVDVLDTIDPEVSTLATLTNVQNSLFIPDLGRYINRRPTYTISQPPPPPERPLPPIPAEEEEAEEAPPISRMATLTSLTSRLGDEHYAVLPHGEKLQGWTPQEIAEVDDRVRHMLHSRKEKFKRGWRGFKAYVKKPLGFFVTVYATLITLFGLAWVLFLIGWINVGGRKDYIVNVIDNVLVALFAIMGDGLAPFRAVDTYHMIFIAHYHRLSWRLRRENALPDLPNKNDLPTATPCDPDIDLDPESKTQLRGDYSVLSPKQQKRLVHHQKKFSRSHTFYKPHETETHYAFSISLLIAIVVLLDCHSCLQIALGTCTWAISYHVRPFALTTVILCCSITCNVTAGILITIGDHKTRKKDVLERMFRQNLTAQAIRKVEKKKTEEESKRNSISLDRLATGSTAQGSLRNGGSPSDSNADFARGSVRTIVEEDLAHK